MNKPKCYKCKSEDMYIDKLGINNWLYCNKCKTPQVLIPKCLLIQYYNLDIRPKLNKNNWRIK